jgi:prepilin-type N-terminal cleavage/methylation domain-containing protein
MQRKRTTLRAPARGGFTLIELLIVMAIITILLSITAAAVFKGFAVVYRMNTQGLIGKIDKRMDRRLAEMRRDAQDWDTGTVLALLNGPPLSANPPFNQRQAKVIQYKLLKKWAFPMYYQDASYNYWLSKQLYNPNGYPFATSLYARLIQRAGFADTTGSAAPPTTPPPPPLPPSPPQQLIAENSGCLATVFEHLGGLDELAANELIDTNGYNGVADGILEIVDGWGTPIMYDRFPVTSPMYDSVKFNFWQNIMLPRAKLAFPAKFTIATDPDDPEKLLSDPNNPLSATQVAALDAVFNNFGTAIPPFRTTFNPQLYPAYTPLVIYSAGPDRTFGQMDNSVVPPQLPPYGLDDLDSYSWRVTVQGQ